MCRRMCIRESTATIELYVKPVPSGGETFLQPKDGARRIYVCGAGCRGQLVPCKYVREAKEAYPSA